MPGRFAGPFNLFRDSNTKERLVKNYAAKLLANAERIVDRPGGSKFQKLVSQHGDLLFTAMVDKTGPRPLYRVFVTGVPLQVVTEEQVSEQVSGLFMESGLCQVVRQLAPVDTRIYYTEELLVDYASANTSKWLDWLDGKTLASTVRVYTTGMPSLAMYQPGRVEQFYFGTNYGARSGKTLLLLQALAGHRKLNRNEYDGQTIP